MTPGNNVCNKAHLDEDRVNVRQTVIEHIAFQIVLIKITLHIPDLIPDLPSLLIPILHIRQCNMRAIYLFLPLRHRWIKTSLFLAPRHQLCNGTSTIVQRRFSACFGLFDICSQSLSGSGVELPRLSVDDDAVVLLSSVNCNELALDFESDAFGRTSERIS
jgi:hypothetical protein